MERVVAGSQDGWTLHASLHEAAGGPDAESTLPSHPVVLLHGLSQQRAYWEPVVRRMAARPVLALDQRGHGLSDADAHADYAVATCAHDVAVLMDAVGWERAVVVGHSWGAAVALEFAVGHPDRTTTAVLIDGGLWGPRDLGDPEVTRERLRPPALGIPADDLWQIVRSGDLGPYWSAEVQEALTPTFVTGADGLLRTRIGMDRHMAVLDGLMDFDPGRALDATAERETPLWVLVAEERRDAPVGTDVPWQDARGRAVQRALGRSHVTTLRMAGAVHDVPLQWPALVAGVLDTVATGRGAQ